MEKSQESDVSRIDDVNLINSFDLTRWTFPKNTFFFSYFGVAITVRSRINADYKSALFLAEKTFRYIERKKKRETIEINPVRSFDDNRVFISGCIMPIAYRVHIRTVSVYIHFINCCAVERRHYIFSKSIV